MIRKAAFRKSELPDATGYGEDQLDNALWSYRHRDDVLAVCVASTRLLEEMPAWSALSGPLPEAPDEYSGWIAVAGRGIEELRHLLQHAKIAP